MCLNVPAEGKLLPFNLKLSFYIGAAVLLLAVLWTIIRTKEYSPAELEEFEKGERIARGELPEEKPAPAAAQVKSQTGHAASVDPGQDVNFYRPGIIWLSTGLVLTFILSRANLEKELYVVTGGVAIFGLLQVIAGWLKSAGKGGNGLNSILTDLRHIALHNGTACRGPVLHLVCPLLTLDLHNLCSDLQNLRILRYHLSGIQRGGQLGGSALRRL